jgi:hypothetical protein
MRGGAVAINVRLEAGVIDEILREGLVPSQHASRLSPMWGHSGPFAFWRYFKGRAIWGHPSIGRTKAGGSRKGILDQLMARFSLAFRPES